MPADPLTLPEREEIRAGIERGEPLVAVVVRLGRHRCTISAEVARNGGREHYRAAAAQARADVHRGRPKGFVSEGRLVAQRHAMRLTTMVDLTA